MPKMRGHLTIEAITAMLERKRQEGGDVARLLPRPQLVHDLLRALSSTRIDALVARHAAGGGVDAKRPGVPHLFVEVKIPKERIGVHQEAEIRFLRTLGLKAGVVRLLERRAPPRSTSLASLASTLSRTRPNSEVRR
jgi:hypothetical protein